MKIAIIGGFDAARASERFKEVKKDIEKEIPGVGVLIPDYFEDYGAFCLLKRKMDIRKYAEKVFQSIEKEVGEEKIVFIGYSMGGLIVRYLKEMNFPIKIKAAILVATPNKGINLSLKEKILLPFLSIPCVKDMRPDSKFLRQFKDITPDYYLFGGRRDDRVNLDSSVPVAGKRSVVMDTDHIGFLKAGIMPKIMKILKSLKTRSSSKSCSFFILFLLFSFLKITASFPEIQRKSGREFPK